MKPIRSEKGTSLIQVLIGVGLVGGLALVLAQMQSQAMKGQNSVRLSSDFNNFTSLVSMVLQNNLVCSSNLNVTNLASLTFNSAPATLSEQTIGINKLTLPNGNVIAQVNSPIGNGLKLTKLELRQFQELTPGAQYIAMVRMEATKNEGTFVGSQQLNRDIPITVAAHVTNGTTVQMDSCGGGQAVAVKTYTATWTPPNPTQTTGQRFTLPCSPGETVLSCTYMPGPVGPTDRTFHSHYFEGPSTNYYAITNLQFRTGAGYVSESGTNLNDRDGCILGVTNYPVHSSTFTHFKVEAKCLKIGI